MNAHELIVELQKHDPATEVVTTVLAPGFDPAAGWPVLAVEVQSFEVRGPVGVGMAGRSAVKILAGPRES